MRGSVAFVLSRISKALVTVDDEAEGRAQVGVGELEGGAGLAEELVRGNGGGVGVGRFGLGLLGGAGGERTDRQFSRCFLF